MILNILNHIQELFSNREIALLIWITVGAILALLFKPFRKFLSTSSNILFQKTFIIIYLLLFAYLTIVIIILNKVHLWDTTLIKDTVFWFITIGLLFVFEINKAKEKGYFKKIFVAGFKWTILLEFISNLYSFSLLSELFLLPFLVFVTAIQAFPGTDNKNQQVTSFLSTFLGLMGLGILLYSGYKTFEGYNSIFTVSTLKSLLFPTIITTLFIPFIYFLALFSTYESFFVNLSCMSNKKDKIKEVKKLVIRIVNFNLNKLIRVISKFEKIVLYDDSNLKSYIIQISKKD